MLITEAVKKPVKQLKKVIKQYRSRLIAYFDSADVYIVSYPNSGRTWLKVLLGKAICDQFGIDETLMLDTRNLTKAARILTTEFTHDCSLVDKESYYYTNQLFFDKLKYRGKKIIFLVRDPRDVMVSYYFQTSKRDYNYQGTISDFIRDEKFGIKKLLKFNSIWYKNSHVPKSFKLFSYEDIQADTVSNFRSMLEFMGVKELKEEILEAAIKFSSLSNMKSLEKQNYWKNHPASQVVQPRNPQDNDSYKARRGKIGGYVDYLSPEDIEYIDSVIAETECPFYKQDQIIKLGTIRPISTS